MKHIAPGASIHVVLRKLMRIIQSTVSLTLSLAIDTSIYSIVDKSELRKQRRSRNNYVPTNIVGVLPAMHVHLSGVVTTICS